MRRPYSLLVLVGGLTLFAAFSLGQSATPSTSDAPAVTPAATSELQPTALATTETRTRRTEGTEPAPYRDDTGKWGLAGLLGLLGLAGLGGRRREVLVDRTVTPPPSQPIPPVPPAGNARR
jgi:MYXO-CTERM domain-containing protein